MIVVLYTRDLEPITAIDLPMDILEAAERDGIVGLALKQPIDKEGTLTLPKQKIIRVECLKIKWLNGELKSILITDNEEEALLLKPEWLVGQRAVIKAYQRTLEILTDKIKKTKFDD
jgi:hypothetical protein